MEINKITFENMENLGISQSFEDLDVNNDGVINEKDKSVATNSTVKNAINTLLNNVDDEAELVNEPKTGAGKTANGVTDISASEFDETVKNSKGTVYVVMGNLGGCGWCTRLDKALGQNLAEIEKVANVYNMDWNANNDLCWEIYRQGAADASSASFPQVAKFVDGKFVELLSNPRDAEKTIQDMLSKAEGTPGTPTEGTDGAGDASKTSGATGTELTEAQKARLEELNKELEEINAELETLNAQLTTLEEEKATLEAERDEAQKVADAAEEELKEAQRELELYTTEYEDNQEKIEQVNKEILAEQNRQEEDFNETMSTLVNKTIDEYDPEKDGDFNAYFAQKMDAAHFPTFAKLNDLNSKAQNLESSHKTLLQNIMSKSNAVAVAKSRFDVANASLTEVTTRFNAKVTEIDELKATIATKEAEKTSITNEINGINNPGAAMLGLSGAEVLSQISDAEKQILKDRNIPLTDCIVATGEYGKFHIYKKSEKEDYYISVARWYGADGGYDICPEGSGFVQDLKEAEAGKGRAVYTFTSVNDDMTDGEVEGMEGCYSMCSPLAFDVNGNGINTTKETVSFDIDGDGILDTVNNADDWVLAFDKDKDGIAGENGSELFGDNTDLDGDGKADGFKDGFAALKALAEKEGLIGNGDNKLDASDLKKLSDEYGLTMTNGYGGEAKDLADLGITEINLATTDKTTLNKNFDGQNNDLMTQEGATFVVNGETHDYADIWNAKKDASENVIFKTDDISSNNVFDTNLPASFALNKDGVIALKGSVDAENIKNKAIDKAEIPKEILEEIIEIKDEEK